MITDILNNIVPVTAATACSQLVEKFLTGAGKIPLPRKFNLAVKGITIACYSTVNGILKQSTYDAAYKQTLAVRKPITKVDPQTAGEALAEPVTEETECEPIGDIYLIVDGI